MKTYKLLAVLLVIACIYACNNNKKQPVQQDTTININTSFNNLFLDSTQLDIFLQQNPTLTNYKQQFTDFYKQRNYEFAWFDENGFTEQAKTFYNLLHASVAELQDSSIYLPNFIATHQTFDVNSGKKISQQNAIKTELLFTGQFFNYAAKVYKGTDVDATELGWFIPRKKVDLSKLLDTLIKTKQPSLEAYIPYNSQYKKLYDYLLKYYQIKKTETWDTIPKTLGNLKSGDSSESISNLKKQLYALGDLDTTEFSNKYNKLLSAALKNFQKRHGLPALGTLNAKTIEQINVPLQTRIEQVLINLERARWLPAEKDSNYIIVNIPEFKMHVYDSATLKWDMNVIVGKAASGTVIFKGNLKYIVFSPYWRLPSNIIKHEVMPGMKRDKNYLAKNDMEIFGKGDSLPLIRQKPGPKNSLGLVKFLFPNSFDIYFHDTPQRSLFSANERSFSHGCIRLSEPKKLAEYLLRADTTYKSVVIDSLMHQSKEKWVDLKKAIPVSLVYFTAWVDNNGKLNFRKDIYKHDEKMGDKLFSRNVKKDSIAIKIPTKA